MSSIPSNFTDGVLVLTDDGGHSATLALSMGDQKLSGLVPDGRALEVYESQGAIVGARKGARARPTFTVTAMLASPTADFHRLAMGTTSGFVSTTADIGDYKACDLSYTFNYGAESRGLTADDVVLTGWEVSAGSPSTVSLSFEILGPLELDGVSVIGSR